MSYDDPKNMTPDECRQMAEYLNVLDVSAENERLERLWHDDPVGMVAFGDDDAWVDARLGRNAP